MRRLAPVLMLAFLPVPLLADTFPSQERGFQAEKAFHLGDFDTVNLFNGNLVLTIPIGGSYPVGGGLSYGLALVYNSKAWDYQQSVSEQTQSLPNRRSNAGMGWRLSLGELMEPTDPANDSNFWIYIGADGAEHTLYDTLHEGEAAVSTVKYSRDNSYLRFRSVSSAEKAVDFPNGTTQTFTSFGQWDWRLSRIDDRHGNWANVIYVHDINTGELKSWKIQDQHGRTQTVNYVTASWYNRVVGSVVLTAFNGPTATYSFGYTQVTIPRACPDNDPQTGNVIVPLLTSVSLPDGSSWSMPTTDYHLDQSAGCRLPGVLKAVTTPLLGRVEWGYGGYNFPVETEEKPWRNASHGVTSRTLKDSAGTVAGTWTYTPSLNPVPGPFNLAREAVRTVITPLGDKTESFFSVALDESGGWSQFDYGLPFTRFVTDGGTRFLSTRTYDCDAGAVNCVLERSSYVTYERDSALLAEFQLNMDRNRRVSSTRTNYDDGSWEATGHSNFDGLGHYRQTVLSGGFEAGNDATQFTNYNPARGTYPGSFSQLPINAAWVLGTYSDQTRTEGGSTAKTEYCFDANTGALQRTRTLKTGSTRGTNDVVSVFTHSSGNVIREDSYGGDVQALGTGELCNLALPANQYRIDHVWQYGVRSSSQYFDAAGVALSFKSLDTDIDPGTGLVRTSRDTSRITTNFEYDVMGRLVWIKPETGHDGWTNYVYTRALNSSNPAQVQILRSSNGGDTTLAESLLKYDSFGRLWQEQAKMADGTFSIRQTNYNALHWKTSVSEQGNTAKLTQYLGYDPFGRPGTIRPPDGSAHDVTLTYSGVRHVSRTSKVGNSHSGGTINEVLSTTQEIYDRQGRLLQVKEQAESNGTDTITTYSYDVGNRLSRVQQSTSAGTQNRWFTYDNRGFLTSEQHPEKGASGNGVVSYSNYDARGHARNKADGPHNLTFTYDRAERLTQVTGNGGQVLKTFSYGTSNAAGVRTNGRLQSATRYNSVGAPFNATVAVTESYTYGGRQGRASSRTTQMLFNGTPSESFIQSWTWNALGDPGSIGYPQCAFAGCTPVSRTVSPGYTNGFLTSVAGWASAISYHPNGMVNQVTHTNRVVDTQANDPNMMGRPSSISSALNGATLWSTGAYAYDGSGNVIKTGNGYFLYDRVSRLIEGRIQDGPTGGGTQKWQSYSYDPFGNIQSIGGTSGRSTPTSASTNRLSGTGTVYDSAGNLTNWNGNVYEYDRFNQMTRMVSGAEDWRYLYTAGDERLWSFRLGGGGSLWALRDLDGRVLREYEAHTSWSTFKDYVYRGSQLLASSHATEGARHFHLDHLGTPRLVTAAGSGGDFHTLTPCRVLDSRNQSAPLAAGETRTVQMAGICGIPSGASAVSANITVVDASTQGDMTAFPAGESRPTASAISYKATLARGNNGILKLGNGALSFFASQPFGSAHLIVDVNGYFTGENGAVVAYHVYYPFGEEATAFNQDAEQMKFTGHERDLGSLAGAGDDLDYMHARHCSPLTGRFLSADTGQSAALNQPQTWNRYNYSRNNPVTRLDPDGQVDQNFMPLMFPDDPAAQAEFDSTVAKGTIAIASLLAPGPEDLVIVGIAGRLGRLFSRVSGRADDVAARADETAGLVADVSKRNMKHISHHLDEFQKLDKSFTLEKQVEMGKQIAANKSNLVSTSGGRSIFEQTVNIGGKTVSVRVVVNANGSLRTIFIPDA
ncbi:MAG TPA: RHS repeat-associated core domain-containing protein [Thermoanaerobaculia bacterium]|nr:RHS repeat-associated core domain-containing protein [Thermoanaerobaculia bacterium]